MDFFRKSSVLELQLYPRECLVHRSGRRSTGGWLVEVAGEENRGPHVGLESAAEVEREVVAQFRPHVG